MSEKVDVECMYVCRVRVCVLEHAWDSRPIHGFMEFLGFYMGNRSAAKTSEDSLPPTTNLVSSFPEHFLKFW